MLAVPGEELPVFRLEIMKREVGVKPEELTLSNILKWKHTHTHIQHICILYLSVCICLCIHNKLLVRRGELSGNIKDKCEEQVFDVSLLLIQHSWGEQR